MSRSREGWSSVLIIIARHAIRGELNLGDQRLSDMLNDVRYSSIELYNAAVSHFSEPGRTIHRTPLATIPKEKVRIAFELAEERVANTQRPFRYQEKRKYPVFFAAQDIEVRGFVHAKATEVPTLARLQERWFVPLTQALVTFCSIENSDFRQDTIVLNLRGIEYFAVGDAEGTPESHPKQSATAPR